MREGVCAFQEGIYVSEVSLLEMASQNLSSVFAKFLLLWFVDIGELKPDIRFGRYQIICYSPLVRAGPRQSAYGELALPGHQVVHERAEAEPTQGERRDRCQECHLED